MSTIAFDTDAEVLVARARELRGLLDRNAASVEKNRALTSDNVDALESSGLLGALAPKRRNGAGGSLALQTRVAMELAKGCASTAWVQTIYSVGAWIASLLPEAGQADLFAAGIPRASAIATMPTGAVATPVDGGYVLKGKWGFGSGSLHAQWCGLLMVPVVVEGELVDMISGFVPMDELRIEDTWYVAGMRGTGSNTVVADRVTIPKHRLLDASFAPGRPRTDRGPGGAPSDAWAFVPVLIVPAMGVLCGAARAILEAVSGAASSRGISYTSYTRQVDSHVVVREIADATLKIEMAELISLRAANETDAMAVAGRPMDPLARMRIRGEAGSVGSLLRQAVDGLLNVGGASAFAESSPIQRHWRDLNVLSRHAFLAPNPCLEVYGRGLLGVEPNISRIL